MILIDTSVWVDHFRTGKTVLMQLLENGEVVMHPFIIGEVALGQLRQRKLVLDAMHNLPRAKVATELEVLHFIHTEAIFGRGIGYVDVHLLASVRLTPGTSLWTQDKRLKEVATQLGLVKK